MIKNIEIEAGVMKRLTEGRYVEGSLHRDQQTGRLRFRAYNRSPRRKGKDRLVCQLEHG